MSLILISIALALDAFGVALSLGLNRGIKYNDKVYFILSFGFFQFLCAFLGGGLGQVFNIYFTTVSSLVGGIIIVIVGLLMVKGGFEKSEGNMILKPEMYLILGVSVSIDAMVVGFTILNTISLWELFKSSTIIGIITMILVMLGFYISKYLKRISLISCYANYIGGIILLIFGIKMMFS